MRPSFQATQFEAIGKNAIQHVSALTNAGIMFFGAKAVIAGQLQNGSTTHTF